MAGAKFMTIISLSPLDLTIASLLVLLMAATSYLLKLGLAKQIVVSAIRMTIQLSLIGFVLKALFANTQIIWISLMAIVMLFAAGREVTRRQSRRFSGYWGFGLGALAMFISSFSITVIALTVFIQNNPWYLPQYAIPLMGMMLGNTMNGISLGLERLTSTAWQQKAIIENRLMLGQDWNEAIGDIRRESIKNGMIPIINAMAAAGLVSLPGMMTGQILAGNPPLEAVKYQILIMFMIAGGSGFGNMTAVWLGSRRLFDDRERLRLDRLKK
jgi:putative ABC transport system permease protein